MRNHAFAPLLVLGLLCLIDLCSTVLLLHFGGAKEGNPLMARFLAFGMEAFVGAKVGFVLIPILVLEWARKLSPAFVNLAIRYGVAGYLLFYVTGVLRANMVSNPDECGLERERSRAWTQIDSRITLRRTGGNPWSP